MRTLASATQVINPEHSTPRVKLGRVCDYVCVHAPLDGIGSTHLFDVEGHLLESAVFANLLSTLSDPLENNICFLGKTQTESKHDCRYVNIQNHMLVWELDNTGSEKSWEAV